MGKHQEIRNLPVQVAVGILVDADNRLLMAKRKAGSPYEGYWEFPGGKCEQDENIIEALKRELFEELGVVIESVQPWCCLQHVYTHAWVRLHFFICRAWIGEPKGQEGQEITWTHLPITLTPLVPASIPLCQCLDLEAISKLPILPIEKCSSLLDKNTNKN